jgi:hypothetical protein
MGGNNINDKTMIEILAKRIETIYQVDYGTEDDGDEYIVKKIEKEGEETWKVVALYNGELTSPGSNLGKHLINYCIDNE